MRDIILAVVGFALVYILWRMSWGSFFHLWDGYYYFRLFVVLSACVSCFYVGRWTERQRSRKRDSTQL